MIFKLSSNLIPPNDFLLKVTAIAFSPNGMRLAIVTTDRTVMLFDENGERRDKFTTKPAEKVRGINVVY